MTLCLDRIAAANPRLNAFVYIDTEGALAAADELDRRLAMGAKVGPLAGVPFGVKDNEDVRGMPTTNGSLFYKDNPPATSDSIVVRRLRAADAIPVGKTAAAEFGLDGVTATRAFGVTRNPWNDKRTPGGSSGGSSAAVAAGMTPFCTGSDGGGSVRVPAAFTGLVGLKPTLGRIPRANGFSDMTSPGVLTRTVADTARLVDILAGADDHDRMSLPKPAVSYERLIETVNTAGLRAAWSVDLGFAPVEPGVRECTRAAAAALAKAAGMSLEPLGRTLTNTYLDWAKIAGHRYRIYLQHTGFWPARRDEISDCPRELMSLYGESTEKELFEINARIQRLEQEVADMFEQFDVVFTPTAAAVPYAAEGPLPKVIDGKDASETNAEPFTIFSNSCWNCSISVPAGLVDNLPVGLLINGRRHHDEVVLRLARLWEQTSPWPILAPMAQ